MLARGLSHFASVLHSKPEDAITETLVLLLEIAIGGQIIDYCDVVVT